MSDLTVIVGLVSALALVLAATDLFWGWLERHNVPGRVDQATRDRIARMVDAEADGEALLAGWDDEVAS